MKIKSYLVFLALLNTLFCTAQNPTYAWAHGWGSAYTELAAAVNTDPAGNVYVAGSFQDTVDFDPGAGTYSLVSNGTSDVFVSKFDASGNFLWVKTIGGTGGDAPYGMTLDASGNILITGLFSNTVDFDPGPSTFTLTSSSGTDIFILKLDQNGNFTWGTTIGGPGSIDKVQAIACDASRNVMICGSFISTIDFDPGPGVYNLNGGSQGPLYVLKLDSNANFSWAVNFGRLVSSTGGAFNLSFSSIKTDVSNYIYVTGNYSATMPMDFDPGIGTYTITTGSVSNIDLFINKLSPAGNYVWTKTVGGTGNDYTYGFDIPTSNNLLLTGNFVNTVDFDPGSSTLNLISAGNTDMYVLNLDTAGNFAWVRQIASLGGESGYAISADASGNVIAAGTFFNTVDFDPGASVYNMTSAGSSDIGIVKLTPAGNFIWATQFGGTGAETVKSIALHPGGGIHTHGTYAGACNFDPGGTNYSLTDNLLGDVYVHKIVSCPAIVNTASQTNVPCFGGTSGSASVTVSGSPGVTYTWSPSGGNLSGAGGLSAGSYSCFISNSCGNSGTQTFVITQPPALSLTAASSQTLLCTGNSATLTASAGGGSGSLSYSWTAGPSSATSVISPTATTIYTVTVTDANNCNASYAITQAVSLCTGINEAMPAGRIKLYPNPFQHSMIIECDEHTEVTVYNSLGMEILRTKTEAKQTFINLEQQAPGVYFIKAGNFLGKMIKE